MQTIPNFETQECTRCGGYGTYSYCTGYGSTCFQCNGKKVMLTKRGYAATQYARKLRTVQAQEVQAGWIFFAAFTTRKWEVVTEVYSDDRHRIIVTASAHHHEFPETNVQAVPNQERLIEIRLEAIRYQETLTKDGKPGKRREAS